MNNNMGVRAQSPEHEVSPTSVDPLAGGGGGNSSGSGSVHLKTVNGMEINEEILAKLTPQELKLYRMYGKLPSKKDLLHHKLQERKYFDSGDYALSKAKGESGKYANFNNLPLTNPSGLRESIIKRRLSSGASVSGAAGGGASVAAAAAAGITAAPSSSCSSSSSSSSTGGSVGPGETPGPGSSSLSGSPASAHSFAGVSGGLGGVAESYSNTNNIAISPITSPTGGAGVRSSSSSSFSSTSSPAPFASKQPQQQQQQQQQQHTIPTITVNPFTSEINQQQQAQVSQIQVQHDRGEQGLVEDTMFISSGPNASPR